MVHQLVTRRGFALPGLLETMPPDHRFPLKRWLDMAIGWVSRTQPAELVTTTAAGRCGDPRTASATYQPVEIGGTAAGRLAEQALARHERDRHPHSHHLLPEHECERIPWPIAEKDAPDLVTADA